jgi:hypothetical protein
VKFALCAEKLLGRLRYFVAYVGKEVPFLPDHGYIQSDQLNSKMTNLNLLPGAQDALRGTIENARMIDIFIFSERGLLPTGIALTAVNQSRV